MFEMLSFRQAFALIGEALKGRDEDITMLRWLLNYETTGKSYDDFVKELEREKNKPQDRRTAQQILDDTEALCAKYGM